MEPAVATLIVELVEKMGLLRRDMLLKKDVDKYEARLARIEQKLSALAEQLSANDPELAKRLRTAWQMPARSLAFRNAEHQKELKSRNESAEPEPESSGE
jgi:DNA repair ATPase RecN